jgi:hypothetical protein
MMLQGTENVPPVSFADRQGGGEPSKFVTVYCPPLSKEVTTTRRNSEAGVERMTSGGFVI